MSGAGAAFKYRNHNSNNSNSTNNTNNNKINNNNNNNKNSNHNNNSNNNDNNSYIAAPGEAHVVHRQNINHARRQQLPARNKAKQEAGIPSRFARAPRMSDGGGT
jgi:hypothetical protein